jgi:glycosyltransferase involved in cell wall biosynthesis
MGRARRKSGNVLIIVQNLSVPRDRRVWLECQALIQAGYGVSVICPQGDGDTSYQDLDGVHIYRYPLPAPTLGQLSFVREFLYCWIRALVLAVRIHRRHGFDVIQACNPPDTYFALALLFKPLGVSFVFDQHDLGPELYLSRFARPSRLVHRGVLLIERLTYLVADHVIATNESYRDIAISRGNKLPNEVTIVRNGPNTQIMRPGAPVDALRRGRRHLCCWIGVMGPQDGVDQLIRAIHYFVTVLGRQDCSFALLGSGDSYQHLVELVPQLGLEDYVALPGWAGDTEIVNYLSTAAIGLSPDPSSPFNDLSTMNKTMEYMAFGLPVVAFDLRETRVSAAEAAVYVPPNDVEKFAVALADLLDDPETRDRMGRAARARADNVLDWAHQVPAYVALYDQLLTKPHASSDT